MYLELNQIHRGNAIDLARKLEPGSISMITTSPPYWSMRAYGTEPQVWGGDTDCDHEWEDFIRKGVTGGTNTSKLKIKGKDNFQIVPDAEQSFCIYCGAWKGELGQEPFLSLFASTNLPDLFDSHRPGLASWGTLWVNIGDTYYGSGNHSPDHPEWQGKHLGYSTTATKNRGDGFQFPGRRGTGGTELPGGCLCNIPHRFAIEMCNRGWHHIRTFIWYKRNTLPESPRDRFTSDFETWLVFSKTPDYYLKDENISGVWDISTEATSHQHFAKFNENLLRPTIEYGCPSGVCVECGNPVEWSCSCNKGTRPGVILDPFMGSGTTALLSEKIKINWIGFELSKKYIEIAEKRLSEQIVGNVLEF